MKEVSAYVNSKYKKNNYYLSKYDINVVINKVSDHVLSQNFYENDSNNDILFYLNLYHRYKQILYQETYFKSSNSIEQIKNDIDDNCFFEDENKKKLFYGKIFNPYYYKLNEYMLYLKTHDKSYSQFDENIINQIYYKLINDKNI